MRPLSNASFKTKTTVIIVVLILVLIPLGSYAYHLYFQNQILPGVYVGQFNLSGLTPTQAKDKLTTFKNQVLQSGINFEFNGKTININPIISGVGDLDFTYWLVDFDIDRTVSNAYNFGRESNLFFDAFNQLRLAWVPKTIPLEVSLYQDEFLNALHSNFSEFENPAQNAKLVYADNEFSVEPESSGLSFDYENLLRQVNNNLAQGSNVTIPVSLATDTPSIKASQTEAALSLAQALSQAALPELIYLTRSWNPPEAANKEWLEFVVNNGRVELAVNREKMTNFIGNIAKSIDTLVKDASFEINDEGRVISFVPHQDGQALDQNKAYQLINTSILAQAGAPITLPVKVVEAKVKTSDVNDLGIVELIGEGRSNFSGSPVNRRHNIGIGVTTLNGLIIKPGEEFSLIEALGDIDASNDYRQELVIKGGKTIPEYGGGLCQIGTTTFRAALAAGVNVTQRRNHSYRVPYYEPAGTDATIYDPWPDFRFVNDTSNNILFRAQVNPNNQDELIFQFWGTSDGRLATRTEPTIYNITAPPPTKWVETTDLEPGQIRCTESAHAGADTIFTQTITYADGTTKEIDYESHYVPWQEVCLKGVTELSTEAGDGESEENNEAVDSFN